MAVIVALDVLMESVVMVVSMMMMVVSVVMVVTTGFCLNLYSSVSLSLSKTDFDLFGLFTSAGNTLSL